MKITTEDCVKFLCDSKHGGNPADWKRRSKCNCPGGVVRRFENISTTYEVSVYERGGSLFLDSVTPGVGWVFAMVDDEDQEAGYHVDIAPRGDWDDDQGCNDLSLVNALRSIGLSESSETEWEPDAQITRNQMKLKLEALGLVNNPKFQKYCDENFNGSGSNDDEGS